MQLSSKVDILRNLERLQKNTVQKMKVSIKDFFRKCDQIRRKLRIWSHLPKKSLMENLIFCALKKSLVESSVDKKLKANYQKHY